MDAETTVLDCTLEPVPVEVSGYLQAPDDIKDLRNNLQDPEPHRIFHPVPQTGIEFVEHESVNTPGLLDLIPRAQCQRLGSGNRGYR